jgi:hypothetical protein
MPAISDGSNRGVSKIYRLPAEARSVRLTGPAPTGDQIREKCARRTFLVRAPSARKSRDQVIATFLYQEFLAGKANQTFTCSAGTCQSPGILAKSKNGSSSPSSIAF